MKKRSRVEQELRKAQLELARMHLRQFEAAKVSRRTENWTPSTIGGTNSELRQALSILQRRHQDLVNNNVWASRAVDVIVQNWIGDGIMASPIGATKRYGQMWNDWADSTECDFFGRTDFYGLQALWSRLTAVRGSALIRLRVEESMAERGLVPLQLQVIDPLDLDTSRDDGQTIYGGKRFDTEGRVISYFLRQGPPGMGQTSLRRLESQEVPASEVIHTFRDYFPGQYTGIPWGAPLLLRLRDLDDYEDAERLKQKLAACFVAFVEEAEVPDLAPTSFELADSLEPGAVEVLPPGRKMSFAQPPQPTGVEGYMKMQLHAIAMGYGISYEALTGILSDVNYSSARMGWLEFHRSVATWRGMTMCQALRPIAVSFAFLSKSLGLGRVTPRMVWTPPRREMIDPTQEVPALRDAVRAGFMSLSDVQRSLGYVPEELMAELQDDLAKARAAGLVVTCDPGQDPERITAQATMLSAQRPPSGGNGRGVPLSHVIQQS